MVRASGKQMYSTDVTVVGAKDNGKVNYMAVAWNTYLNKDPNLFGVSIANRRYTHDLIENSGEFNCNFLPHSKKHLIYDIGHITGKNCNKVEKLNLDLKKCKHLEVPRLKSAYAAIECEVYKKVLLEDHTLYIGEIVHMHGKDKLL